MKRSRLTTTLPAFVLAGVWIACPAKEKAATLNVIDFGARGDAIQYAGSVSAARGRRRDAEAGLWIYGADEYGWVHAGWEGGLLRRR